MNIKKGKTTWIHTPNGQKDQCGYIAYTEDALVNHVRECDTIETAPLPPPCECGAEVAKSTHARWCLKFSLLETIGG